MNKQVKKSQKKEKSDEKSENQVTEKIKDLPKEKKPEVIEKKKIETPPVIKENPVAYALKELDAIDDSTETLLFDNGIKTIKDLKKASKKDLTRIKGIDRKTAKNIIKELSDKPFKELSHNVGKQEGEVNTAK